MLFMIIERFRSGDAAPVYARFRSQGRLAPEGLKYISSWVSEDMSHCYQLMEADKTELLDEWMSNWKDLVDFEVVPVVTSAEASARAGKEEEKQCPQGSATE
ncbi:hypothetical protein BU26DRAFT_68912 [Trematosphaeria pertusa]|uniref:DUF3303 domain-containing protein n=1 Tax=Trematosphaeria pertusa TaxID=390896 RepID=A0A6A6I690_9PLEO|nr:uncharacterized protein BU26DRAFT_68912 [Trematosphaeria pertusa]KAF2245462.1 hypothetical protein BU26DRAFT_68912 [Trematosphaeria pertusa]